MKIISNSIICLRENVRILCDREWDTIGSCFRYGRRRKRKRDEENQIESLIDQHLFFEVLFGYPSCLFHGSILLLSPTSEIGDVFAENNLNFMLSISHLFLSPHRLADEDKCEEKQSKGE